MKKTFYSLKLLINFETVIYLLSDSISRAILIEAHQQQKKKQF